MLALWCEGHQRHSQHIWACPGHAHLCAVGCVHQADHALKLACRHYTDVLLIAVIALCTVENDVIHAAYLALALLLFRRRDALRTERQSLFKWLPLYNFLVMLITLAYQAPFNSSWDHNLRPYLVSL